MEDRIVKLEARLEELTKKHIAVMEQFATTIDRVLQFLERLVTYQKDSLPIPQVMKLFSFFAMLVIAITSAMLGLKWAAGDFFKP